jgi:membrane associated rhomboid family serine protease
MVKWLLVAHIAAHILLLLSWRLSDAGVGDVYRWVGLAPAHAFGSLQLWQLVSYIFVHDLAGIWHFFFNLLMLFFFAGEIERLYGDRRFLLLYFGAGVFAGLLHCLAGAFTDPRVPLIGASGAIYAVLVAFALHFPRRKVLLFFLLPIEVWLLVALMIGLDMVSYLSGGGGGTSNLAHLGGAFFGFVFVRYRHVLARAAEAAAERREDKRQKAEQDVEKRLDALLDKINREGMTALSDREKTFLKQASKRYQNRGPR